MRWFPQRGEEGGLRGGCGGHGATSTEGEALFL